VNLLLLNDEDLLPDGTALLRGRRAAHAREVLRSSAGDSLRVGRLGGQVGTGRVLAQSGDELRLAVTLEGPPPPRPGLDLLLALPRPKALKRVLLQAAQLGVDRLVLLNAARVEKSYFDSKVLAPAFIERLLLEGLEQAQDTVLPQVLIRERFRPFVEDELVGLLPLGSRFVAHPAPERSAGCLDPAAGTRTTLAVGPEGGWVPFELELLEARGFQRLSAGPRTLRVEAAIPYLLGLLAAGRR
jgi:RsmE family RNA methyltransferase